MVYGSETWALKKAHMELLSVAQRKMERIMLGITLRRVTWGKAPRFGGDLSLTYLFASTSEKSYMYVINDMLRIY